MIRAILRELLWAAPFVALAIGLISMIPSEPAPIVTAPALAPGEPEMPAGPVWVEP